MAIAYSTSVNTAGGSGTISESLGASIASGQLLVAVIAWSAASSIYTPAITDTVNSGGWTFPASYQYNGGGGFNPQLAIAYKVSNASGTPTVNLTGLGTDGTDVSIGYYTGFANTPTLVTVDSNINHGTSTAIAATGITNTIANELTVVFSGNAYGTPSAITGSFTIRQGYPTGFDAILGDVIESTSGNALSFGATIGASNEWAVGLVSFQDLAAGTVYQPFTSTQFFVNDVIYQR